MPKTHKFKAEIKAAEGGGAYVNMPFDVEKTFGKKRVKIVADIDGEIYRGSLVRYNSPLHMLLIRKAIREKIGKQAGDIVSISIKEDTEPRVVEVPKDFAELLKQHPKAKAIFEAFAYTHKREYVVWITEAKKQETRERRMNKAIEMIGENKKRS